jgi:ABC-type Zn uptake system ZnuABC Zn-binding protein ZnuA
MFTYTAPVSRGSISIRATNPDKARRYEVHGEHVQVSAANLQEIADFFAEAAAALAAQETEAEIELAKTVAAEASEATAVVPKGKRGKKAE